MNVSANSPVKVYGYTEAEINNMSHEEFTEYIAKIVALDVSFEEIQINLERVGVTISRNEMSNNSRASVSTDATLSVYSSKRAGSAYYYLTACVTAKKDLAADCATEDIISIEWDPARASYYSKSATTNTTYMDGSQRNNGVLLFNVQDANMHIGDTAICSAVVKPNGSGWLDYASKYIHTYSKTSYSWTIGGNVNYSQNNGLAGGATFSVSGTAENYSWQIYEDNSVSI